MQRQPADRDGRGDPDAAGVQPADVEPLLVGAVALQQGVLDDDRQAERGHDGIGRIDADEPVEHDPLEDHADEERPGEDDHQRQERVDAERVCDDEAQVGAEHGDVAVGEVHEPHHAEEQREPRREHGVEATEEDPLDHGVHPCHARLPLTTPAVRGRSRPPSPRRGVTVVDAAASEMRPSSRQYTRRAARRAWRTSCSTRSTVVPLAEIRGSAP